MGEDLCCTAGNEDCNVGLAQRELADESPTFKEVTSSMSDVMQQFISNMNPMQLVPAPQPSLPLNGESSPVKPIVERPPEQRLIVYLKAQGHSYESIAEKTGYKIDEIREILNQPWAKQRLIKEITQEGDDAVSILVAGTAADCVLTLIELRDDKKAPAAVRMAACRELLDRFRGKAPVGDNGSHLRKKNLPTTLEELDSQIAALEEVERTTIARHKAHSIQVHPENN